MYFAIFCHTIIISLFSLLQNELQEAENGDFRTRLNIVFMTSSVKSVDDMDPDNLPSIPTSLDVWILRDQSILLTKNWNSEDEVIYMEFEKFENMTRHQFSQPLLPKTESFNQGLVIIGQKLKFVSFNSPLTFLAIGSVDLNGLKQRFSKLFRKKWISLSSLLLLENCCNQQRF